MLYVQFTDSRSNINIIIMDVKAYIPLISLKPKMLKKCDALNDACVATVGEATVMFSHS